MLFFSQKSKSSEAGFTILEVLVVVIIIGILAAIAAPSWLAYANRQRMGAVQSDLVQAMKQAQQRAIRDRSSVTIAIEEDEERPTIAIDGNAQVIGPADLSDGAITLDAASPNADTPENIEAVTFDYQGMVRGDQDLPFVVKISPRNSDAQQCVVVATILGNVKTLRDDACDGDGAYWDGVLD